MEPALVLQTKSFALNLYSFLREIDPARWKNTRKQALKDRVRVLETELESLYASAKRQTQDLDWQQAHEGVASVVVLQKRLNRVGTLLSELGQISFDSQMSYLQLYSLRKRLQKAYQGLSLIMEACSEPIPHIRPSNLVRSLFHASSAVAILLMIALVPSFDWMFWIAVPYFAFCWTTEGLKRVHPAVKARVMKFFEKIAHPHEYDKVNSATWYGVALLLLSLTNPVLGIIGVTVLGFADPAAAMVGRKYGSICLPGNRTLEGSFGFVVVGTLAASLALAIMHPIGGLGSTLLVAGTASLFGAVGELLGRWPDDNLTIPLASALGAWLALMLV